MRLSYIFSVVVSGSPREVEAALRRVVSPPKGVVNQVFSSIEGDLDESGLSDRYEGIVTASSFRFARPVTMSRGLWPVVDGTFRASRDGTAIDVVVAHPRSSIVGLAVVSGFVVAGTVLVAVSVPSAWRIGIPGLALVGIWWFAFFVVAHRRARRVRHLLLSLCPSSHVGA